MIKKTFVKSFYTSVLVTCYECDGVKYVANQHGSWDVYDGEYERGGRSRTVHKDAEEIKKIITQFKQQEIDSK
ncbi:MAG: hypothetical protein HQL08_05840 [Nitrospirae bacterium]|nr:hypothetical protein [Nitrospirota bacterium]